MTMADRTPEAAGEADSAALFAKRFPTFALLGSALGRRAAAAAPTAPAANPALALFAAPIPGAGGDRGARYRTIEEDLERDARALDTAEIGEAHKISDRIGAALLARLESDTILRLVEGLRWMLLVLFVGALTLLIYQVALKQPLGVLGFATSYFFGGLLLAVFFESQFDGGARQANRRFAAAERDLVDLVGRTTQDLRDRLSPLRAAMQIGGAGGPQALNSAAEARLATAGALRFFNEAPLLGVDEGAEGASCHNVTAALRSAGAAAAARTARGFSMFGFIVLGVAIGAVALFTSLSVASWRAVPAIVTQLWTLERATPGAVSLLFAIFGALGAAMIIGLFAAQNLAAQAPGAVMRSDPARGLANSLHLKSLRAAAESKREFVERYADAVIALESRASKWNGATSASAVESDIPAWRRTPEGPRFVATGFQATPKAFFAGADGKLRVAGASEPAPKRSLFDRLKPPGA